MMPDLAMEDFKNRIKRIKRLSLIALGVFALGVLTPFTAIFLGLALGTVVSFFNLIITARKVNKIGEIAANRHIHNGKPVFPGTLTRLAMVVLAIMLVYQYPAYFDIFSTMIGLFVAQVISIVDGIIYKF